MTMRVGDRVVKAQIREKQAARREYEGAKQAGLVALEGHRSVGGMRASIYNAMPMAGVEALVEYMREFQRVRA